MKTAVPGNCFAAARPQVPELRGAVPKPVCDEGLKSGPSEGSCIAPVWRRSASIVSLQTFRIRPGRKRLCFWIPLTEVRIVVLRFLAIFHRLSPV